jgi:hypothetical protein
MATDAPFAQRFVFENERTPLRRVTLKTGFVLAQECHPAAFNRLRKIGATPFDGHSDVRVVAISATDLPFQYRMMMRQLKLCADLEVTLKTGFR